MLVWLIPNFVNLLYANQSIIIYMIFNTFQTNFKHTALRRLASLICVVCGLLALSPSTYAQTTKTVVVTLNGYSGYGNNADKVVNIDCSGLKPAGDQVSQESHTVSADGINFSVPTQTNNQEGKSYYGVYNITTPTASAGVLLKNQQFVFSLDGKKISSIELIYSTSATGKPSGWTNAVVPQIKSGASFIDVPAEGRNFGKLQDQATFYAPYSATQQNQFCFIHGAVIKYTDADNTNPAADEPVPAEEINFSVPTVANGTITVANGNDKVANGTKLAVGTQLTVSVKPTDNAKYYVSEVKYGTDAVSGSTDADGTWTGTITVAKDARLSATLAIKTFKLEATAQYGTVTFVNPSNGTAIENPSAVPYGTNVGIQVDNYDNTKEIASIICKDALGNDVTLGAGNAHCAATVNVTSDLNITVAFQDKAAANVEVTFQQPQGGTISVSADGKSLSSPALVAAGTELTIVLTPAAGYTVGGLTVAGEVKTPDENNTVTYTIPQGENSVYIQATFVKVYTVTWEAPADGTMTVKNASNEEIASGATVKGGEKLTVTLTPNQSDMVTSLTANGSAVNPTSNKNIYNVTITADTELVPYIGKELKSYNLGLVSVTGGSVKIWDNANREGNPVLSGSGTKAIKEGTALYGSITVTKDYVLDAINLSNVGNIDFDPMNEETRVVTFSFTMPARATNLTPAYTRIMPDRTVTVTIPDTQADMGSVSYKIGENGSLTQYSAPFTAKQGDVITFVIKAADDYRIKSVSPNLTYSVNTATEKTGTYTLGTSNLAITVNFEAIPERTITITGINLSQLPAGVEGLAATYDGSDVVFGETTIPEGATVEFTLTANEEYEITKFTVGNVASSIAEGGASATVTYTMTTATSVKVDYALSHRMTNITFRLNDTDITNMGTVVAKYKDGNATKTIQPNTSTQTQSVPTATPLTVEVTPTRGYIVKTLEINGVAVDLDAEGVTNASTRVVTVKDCYTTPSAVTGGSDALTVVVTFDEIPVYYSFNVTATGGKVPDKDKPLDVEYGTVTYTSTGDLSDMKKVLKGTVVNVTATPEVNYQIKSITVNGKAQEFDITAASVTVPVTITQATTVAVVFEARTYRVQVFASPSKGGNPYVATSGTAIQSYSSGSRVTIYAPVNPGYKFVKWLLNGQDVMNGNALAGSTYSFTMPQADQRFTAVYEEVKYTPHSVRIQVAEGQEDWGTIEIIYPTSQIWTSWNQSSVYIQGWDQYVEVEAKANTAEEGHRYYFDGWQITGAASGTVTQTTAADKLSSVINYGGNNNVSITAKFGQNYKVSVVAPVNGTVEVVTADGTVIRPNNPIFVKAGTKVTVTMTSNKNYNLSTLAVNGRETSHYNRPGTFSQTVTINEDTQLNALFYNPSGIEDINADEENASEPEQWFTVQGQYVGTERPTAAGIYIRRIGSKASKIVVR